MQTTTPTAALNTIITKIDDTLSRGQRWQGDYLRHVLRLLRQTAAQALDNTALDSELVDLSQPLAPMKEETPS